MTADNLLVVSINQFISICKEGSGEKEGIKKRCRKKGKRNKQNERNRNQKRKNEKKEKQKED